MPAGAAATTPSATPSAARTPGEGVTAHTLAESTAPHGLDIHAEGPTDVTVRVIVVEPGGSTGWHHHDGPLLAVVVSGTLTRTLDDCSVELSTAGDTILETPGADHVHVGRNLGEEPVVLHATYLVPEGRPLSVDADAPDCAG
nr:cupin domain-containing protein [Streptomyces avicenniae]